MLKTCKHSNCAVCKAAEEREVFRYILETMYPDVFICKDAMYKIATCEKRYFIINSLEYLSKGKKGYFIQSPYTSKIIYLNKNNFEVVCSNSEECKLKPTVSEYIPKQKKTTY